MADRIDWFKAVIDNSSVRAIFGGRKLAPNPTDRWKNGPNRHLINDGNEIPFEVIQTGANLHDSQLAIPMVDAIPSNKRPGGGRRQRPTELYADRAYDAKEKIRRPLGAKGIIRKFAKRHIEHWSGLGKHNCAIEDAFAWLFLQKRLLIRYERREEIYQAFLSIGCIIICWTRLVQFY